MTRSDDAEVTRPVDISFGRRAWLSGLRRTKQALLPGDTRLRRQRAGLAAGLQLETNFHGPAYFYLGLYEYEIAGYVRAMAYPLSTSFDIGAGWGYYSLVLSKLTGGQVVAFEVDERSLERLGYHLQENGAVGARVQLETAFVTAQSRAHLNEVALDDIAGTAGVPLPDLIKMDVEGGEVDGLRGARRLLREHRPHIIVETHSAKLERECGDLLLEAGYRPRVVARRTRFREDRPAAENRWLVAKGERPCGLSEVNLRDPGPFQIGEIV